MAGAAYVVYLRRASERWDIQAVCLTPEVAECLCGALCAAGLPARVSGVSARSYLGGFVGADWTTSCPENWPFGRSSRGSLGSWAGAASDAACGLARLLCWAAARGSQSWCDLVAHFVE
jgi:hypothetical protein